MNIVRKQGEEMQAFRLRQLGLDSSVQYDWDSAIAWAIHELGELDSEWANNDQMWTDAVEDGEMSEIEFIRLMREMDASHDSILEHCREEVWASLGWSE
jgi:hypothetical protein